MIEEGSLPGCWQRWHSHGWPRDTKTNVVGDMLVCRLGLRCERNVGNGSVREWLLLDGRGSTCW